MKNNNIESGDLVEYIDSGSIRIGKSVKTVKIPIYGIWDGEKVQLTDKDKTLVRNREWLKVVEKNFNWKCRFDKDNINRLIIESVDGKTNASIVVPPGRNRIDLINFEKCTTLTLGYFKGYKYGFNGLVVVSEGSKRKILYKGMLLNEIDYNKNFYD